ncbi:MAG: L,D-transpeptidase family protein [Betaproteobacteria bacterium]|nr:L,D-transpeptidase family protein [Betaproteobacteria bacterium]
MPAVPTAALPDKPATTPALQATPAVPIEAAPTLQAAPTASTEAAPAEPVATSTLPTAPAVPTVAEPADSAATPTLQAASVVPTEAATAIPNEAMPVLQATPAAPIEAASTLQAAPAVPTEATPAPAAPAPVVQIPPAGFGVAQKLQELIATRLADFIERKPEQAAVEAFYRERGFQPLWTSNGAATARAAEVAAFLKNVASEGLDPSDYPVPNLAAKSTDDEAAANELKLTRSLLTYARHASSGRVSYTRVSASILYPANALAPEAVLLQVALAQNARDTLLSFEPQHTGFKALKAALAAQRNAPQRESAPARRGEAKPARVDSAGLIVANMERWRWLPRDLGAAHVIVDVPDYTLAVFNGGKELWRTKIVVGKPNLATPLLSETMKYLTINPTWNVPPSIIRNEYLPKLERDPDALERIGLKVARNHDGSLRVYQPPGERNALGRIRFNFPNVFLVYQHDTPQKSFFARETRALSHGCMRVHYPEKYAELLLSLSQPEDGFTIRRISSLYGGEERTINLKRPISVHVTYQTAVVDETGQLKTRDDIYGLDAAILKLMRGNERAVADLPIARDYKSSSKPVMARLPERSAYDARASAEFDEDRGSPSGGWNRRGWGNQGYGDSSVMTRWFERAVGSW